MPRRRGEFSPLPKPFQGSNGRFQKGKHWRAEGPHWNKEWLNEEYTNKQRSASEIAEELSIQPTAIYFWMNKHGIRRRTISEARAIKHWGCSGEANPMFGRVGPDNPNWRGGATPERQACYASIEWKRASRMVKNRDNWTCQCCGKHRIDLDCRIELHHIIPFAEVEFRTDPDNLVVLCEKCHDFVHSKENHTGSFLEVK